MLLRFRTPTDWARYESQRAQGYQEAETQGISYRRTSGRQAASATLVNSVQNAKQKLIPTLPPHCAANFGTADYTSFGWCEALASEIPDLLSNPLIALVEPNPDGGAAISSVAPWSCPLLGHWGIRQVATNLRTDCANEEGFFADNFPVGQLENWYEPFAATNNYWSLGYTPELTTTTDYIKFVEIGGGFCGSGARDRSEHPTGVASMIGSYNYLGDPGHAAQANLFFANGFFSTNSAGDVECQTNTELIRSLEWLIVENGVRLINESYVCAGGSSQLGAFIRDYFARYHDVVFVRAAGNLGGENLSSARVHCYEHNLLCVGAHDGGTISSSPNSDPLSNHQQAVAEFSKYQNPDVFYQSAIDTRTDREEPDLLAPGRELIALWGADQPPCHDCNDAFRFPSGGTSFAAPGLVGQIALAAEQITGLGWQSCRFSEWARGLSKAAAIEHTKFMIPQPTGPGNWTVDPAIRTSRLARHIENWQAIQLEDERHGAGSPEFDRMLGWTCRSQEDAFSMPEDMVPLDSNLADLDRVHPNTQVGSDHPSTNGISQTQYGFVYDVDDYLNDPANFSEPALRCDSVGREESDVWLYRVVLEWSSCPGMLDQYQNEISRPETDFNLSLRTPSGDEFWMSTSFDDNSESFEFCRTEPGSYTVSVVPTVQDWGCLRDPDDPHSDQGEWKYLFIQRTRAIDPETDCPTLRNYGHGFGQE